MMIQRGLYVVLGALVGYMLFGTFASLGFAAVAVNLLTPLPAAYVGMRCGSPAAGLAVALTALLVALTGDSATALMYLVQFGIPGALLPLLLNRGVAWDKATVIVLWAMVFAGLCSLMVASLSIGESPVTVAGELIGKEIGQTAKAMQDVFATADLPAEQKAEVEKTVAGMMAFLQQAYPGIAIAVSGMMTLGAILLLSAFSRGRYVVPGRPFQSWKAPELMVWALIAAGFSVVFLEGLPGIFALNVLVILLPVYFLQGLAVIDCFFRRKAFSPVFRGVGYVLVTLINPLPLVVTGIGVFDLWADFRKPRQPES